MDIWILVAGVEFGPYSEEKVREHLAEGLAAMSDSARSTPTEEWTTLGEILSRPRPTIPVTAQALPARKSMAESQPLPQLSLPNPPPLDHPPPGSEIAVPTSKSTEPEPFVASPPKPLRAPLAPFHFSPDNPKAVTAPLFQVPRMPIAPSAKVVAKRKPIVLSGHLGLSSAANPHPSSMPKEDVWTQPNLPPPGQPALSSLPENKSAASSITSSDPPISPAESTDSPPVLSGSILPPPSPVVSASRPASSPLPPSPKSPSSFLPPIRVPLPASLSPPSPLPALNSPPSSGESSTPVLRFKPEAAPKALKPLAPPELSQDTPSAVTLGVPSRRDSANVRQLRHPDSLKNRPAAKAKTPLPSEKTLAKFENRPAIASPAAKKARPPAPVELTGIRRKRRAPRFLFIGLVLACFAMVILWMVQRPVNVRPAARPKEVKIVLPPGAIDPLVLRNHLDQGEALFQKEDWKGALLEYNAALDIDPESSTAYYGRGRTKAAQNEWDGAIADFTQALQLNPQLANASYHRGFVRQKRGDLDGALADYTQATQATTPIPLAFYYRGLIEEQRDELESALNDISRALELDPRNAQAFYNRGLCRLGKGDLAGAMADLNHFCEITAKDSYLDYAQLYLFIVHAQQNQTAEANRQLSDRLNHGWNSSGDDLVSKIAQYLLGQITDADLVGATAAPDALKDQQQRCEAFYFIGAMRQLAGDHDGAVAAYQKGVSTQEKDFCEFILAREALHRLGVVPPALLPPTVGP